MNDMDTAFMHEALELARMGFYTATPNPCVGCVIVSDQQVVGRGFHRRTGEAHAEVLALREAGAQAHGATLYVTLEPCAHQGRTPPCVSDIIEAGISRVVMAVQDPNPHVNGRGRTELETAGIACQVGIKKEEAWELNIEFFHRMLTGLPWVRIKQAVSLDGGSALADGRSQWISGSAARDDVQHLRARAGAVLSTAKTIERDRARLNVRLGAQELEVDEVRQPLRVIADRGASLSTDLVFWDQDAPVVVYTLDSYQEQLRKKFPELPIEVVDAEDQGLHLGQMLEDLASNYEINDVLVEAGPRFAGALLRQGRVDELIVYIAPRLLGEGSMPLADIPSASDLPEASEWKLIETKVLDSDIRATYRRNPDVYGNC